MTGHSVFTWQGSGGFAGKAVNCLNDMECVNQNRNKYFARLASSSLSDKNAYIKQAKDFDFTHYRSEFLQPACKISGAQMRLQKSILLFHQLRKHSRQQAERSGSAPVIKCPGSRRPALWMCWPGAGPGCL